jgi:UDP-N-acetylmuramate dehydrogenase
MQILNNVSLAKYTTMRLGGPAKFLTSVHDKVELMNIVKWSRSHNMPLVTIGGGSNILFTDEGFKGMVIVNKIPGFEIIGTQEDQTKIKIGAGESWDSVVKRTIEMGLSGIEALSMIPGTAGAAPVQNIGAYGQELADTFIELEAYDLNSDQYAILNKEDCQFGYRDSIFKNANPRRYIIVSITLKLSQSWMSPPFYATLQEYLNQRSVSEYSPRNIRAAVIAIRKSKLPDPKDIASAGSFFKSAVVGPEKFAQLRQKFSNIPGYEIDKMHIKIPSGWLVEKAGYKGVSDENGMGTYGMHALVVVNHSATSYQALDDFAGKIVQAVQEQFGITLEREPELISSS